MRGRESGVCLGLEARRVRAAAAVCGQWSICGGGALLLSWAGSTSLLLEPAVQLSYLLFRNSISVGDVDLIPHRYLPTMAEIAGLAFAIPAIIDILIKGGAKMYARVEEARNLDETMGR
jgi:hypothetical protein